MRIFKAPRGGRLSPFKAGLLGAIVLVVFCYAAATKFANPLANPYTVHVIFANANGLKPQSLVREAGINVGTVDGVAVVPGCQKSNDVETQCQDADVTMSIKSNGLPLHKDATFWIRPRTFLEGNFFVDVSPGTPEAPTAKSGYVFPASQGVEPVQFDQLLTSLQFNTRQNLQTLLQQYGIGVKEGGPDFNKSIIYWTPAYEYGAEVSHDFLGTEPNDLSGWIDKGGTVNGALSAHPQNLENLVTDFNTTAGAFARENVALGQAVHELPVTLQVAIPALNALNNAFPPLREFARKLVPGVVSTGPMVDASLPFFHQLRELVQPSELQGLTKDLSKTVPALAKLNAESTPFMKNEVRPASSCQVNVVLPWTRLTIQDQNFNSSNGFPARPVYVEGVDYLPGLAGESRDFDANGPYIRILGTGGTATYSLSPGLFGQALTAIDGVQPALPAPHTSGDGASVPVDRPPLEPNVPCETQQAITQSGLQAPVGVGPQQVGSGGTGLPLPTLPTLESKIVSDAVTQIKTQAQQAGMGVRLTTHQPTGNKP
jgi:phospholipid/cholesterol/gamma-HCH transport system substrate-binding protein